MPNQEIEQYDNLPLRYAYQFLIDNSCSDVANEIRFSQEKYKSYKSGLKRAKIVNILDQKDLLNSFIEQYWHNGSTQKGQNYLNSLRRVFDSYLNDSDIEEDDAEEEAGESSFAYEEDLKNYLIANLSIIETGIKLYKDENGIDGIEYPIDPNNKRVDILAIDRDGIPVVIELKVSRGYEKVIGQCLYYKNRVKKLLNVEKVRIIIIAREISQNLKTAIEDLSDVQLFEYRLSVKLEPA
jgi:hypothetical protein